MEAKIGSDFPPAITHPEFFYGFVGIALVFQIIFLIIAREPLKYRLLMLISVLFVMINLVVDLLYYAVDPRLRMGRPGAAR